MVIFGSITRQYFQKFRFDIIFSRNDYKMVIKTIFLNENMQFLAPLLLEPPRKYKREIINFFKRTRNFRYRAKIGLAHLKKKKLANMFGIGCDVIAQKTPKMNDEAETEVHVEGDLCTESFAGVPTKLYYF